MDRTGLFVRPPYIHNATWASLGFSGPLWASLSLSQPARDPPAKRMTGLFYPRSGPLGLSGHLWASLGLSHRGSPRGLPLGFHTKICGEPAWSSPAKRMTGFFLSTLHLSGLLWASLFFRLFPLQLPHCHFGSRYPTNPDWLCLQLEHVVDCVSSGSGWG